MKLNTDIRLLIKGKREEYPTKRTMNLYYKEDRTTATATAMLYILFALTVLLALGKILVYDPWNTAQELEAQLAAMQTENTAMQEQLTSYDEVERDYIRRVSTVREQEQIDPMELLDLIDSEIRPAAVVSQVTIEDGQAVVSFSGVSLEQSADLVARLEQSELVKSTYVETAVSQQTAEDEVEVHVYLDLAGKEEAES